VVVLSKLAGVLKDYRQRLLNTRVMLSLRRALYDRLLHLPLPRLWGMKTGGILSRLSGRHRHDHRVVADGGRLARALDRPPRPRPWACSWRSTGAWALMALAVIPGAVLMSFVFARRVRPIYRSVRKDVEVIDGRAGETFAGDPRRPGVRARDAGAASTT